MPLDILAHYYLNGFPEWFPSPARLAALTATVGALAATKRFVGGSPANRSERKMHGRVVMLTGGTSGIGAAVALDLARRGAHLVLLTAQPPADPFVVDYVEELREAAGHQLVYAEQCDLSSLHSVRTFATKWIDNLPVRRLDMVILCAAVTAEVAGAEEEEVVAADDADDADDNSQRKKTTKNNKNNKNKKNKDKTQTSVVAAAPRGRTTPDGIERAWMVNYLANFHLLTLLSPALRAQPFDRDVRVIVATCSAYIGAPPLVDVSGAGGASSSTSSSASASTSTAALAPVPRWTPRHAYARSKLALMVFARAFQKQLDAFERPDKLPCNVRVLLVDPGPARTPGFRRWLAGGPSLWALVLLYVLLYPLWWLLVPGAEDGAQSVLFAAMDGGLRRMQDFVAAPEGAPSDTTTTTTSPKDRVGRSLVKACRLVDVARRDVDDAAVGRALWADSEALVQATEKRAALRRQADKAAREAAEKAEAEARQAAEKAAQEAEQAREIGALVDAIKKGKQREAAKAKTKGKASQ